MNFQTGSRTYTLQKKTSVLNRYKESLRGYEALGIHQPGNYKKNYQYQKEDQVMTEYELNSIYSHIRKHSQFKQS